MKNVPAREGVLRRRLLAAFLAVSLVPLFGSNAMGFLRSRDIVGGLVERYVAGVADLQASHVQERIEQQRLYLEAVASGNRFLQAAAERATSAANPGMSTAASPEATTEYLQRKLEESGHFDAFALFEPDGVAYASSSAGHPVEQWSPHGAAPFGLVSTGPDSPPMLRFVVPVTDAGGATAAYLAGTVLLGRGEGFLDIPEHVAGAIESFIVDDRGLPVFVSHPHGPLRYDRPLDSPLVGAPPGRTDRYIDREGVAVIGASAALPRYSWLFVTEVPAADALGELRGLRSLSWVLGGVFSLMVVLAGWGLAGGIAAPVRRLLAATRKLADGDLAVRVPEGGGDEIGELSEAFNQMATELAANQERIQRLHRREIERAEQLATVGELASGIAHEIKNPVVGISNGLDLVLRHVEDQPDLTPITTEMKRQLHRIERAVRDLLAFARPREPKLESTDVNEVVRRALALVEAGARKSGIPIRVDLGQDLPHVWADAELLGQAVVNLVLNAIQFSGEGSPIDVQTFVSSGELGIRVADRGPGIEQKNLAALFKPFYTTRHSGTGLGLSITRGIAEQHQGRIDVDSTVGEGSCFTIVLPLDARSAEVPS